MYLFKRQTVARDRIHAGEQLAQMILKKFDNSELKPDQCLVLALPRGGLPVAAPITKALKCPLDVIVSKKIGFPGHEEYAIGAISSRGTRELNPDIQRFHYQIPASYIESESKKLMKQCEKKEQMFRGALTNITPVKGKTVFLVDDGIATGMTMKVAVRDVFSQEPKKIIIAVPVLSKEALSEFSSMKEVSQLLYMSAPDNFQAVGLHYDNFTQTTDEEAKQIMDLYHPKEQQNTKA